MLTIKSIVAKNMRTITLITMGIILFLSTFIQILDMQRMSRQNALETFSQVERIAEKGPGAVQGQEGLSYIFSLLETGDGPMYAVDPATARVVGATDIADVDRPMTDIGIQAEGLGSERGFYAKIGQRRLYCLSKKIGETYIVWTTPISGFFRSVLANGVILLIGVALISVIMVTAVMKTMERTVIGPIDRINQGLRTIQEGDLLTVVDTWEFSELSAHINSMVTSVLQNSEKLMMSEQIREQKEELERQQEELEAAVKRAEAASKAKSVFLFNMSHDIRTPMNAILGFTSLMQQSDVSDIQRGYLKNIDISSRQLLEMLDNVLELASLEDHKLVIEEEQVDVNETYDKLCTIFDSDLKKKSLTCTTERDIQHPYMFMDTKHYSQIFLNTMSNAIKYTPEGGAIAVRFRELPGETPDTCFVETVVEDSGVGMSEEFLSYAFESFAREYNSTASGIHGTGLGLSIVKHLVDLMNGTVSIESELGKGTKVVITLPHRLGEAPAAEDPQKVESGYISFEGRHILLAEDIEINAMIAMKLLSGQGFVVDRAKDGVECVDMLLKASVGFYEVILMDIQMPNMDGYEATRVIRSFEDETRAAVPILAMTANTLQEDRDKAAEAGMNGYIAKPIDVAVMFKTIAETLQGQGRA